MGPEATALFYMKLIKKFQNTKGYPRVLIYSVPEPFQIADSLLKFNQDGHILKKLIIHGIKTVQKSVDFCVIPCNTAHIFIDSIRRISKVPVLSIVEETCRHLMICNIKRVGILATTATIEAGLYQRFFYENNIIPILPNKSQQVAIAEIIVRIVMGKIIEKDKVTLLDVIGSLNKIGAECIILACTDLPILISQRDTSFALIDTLDILAEAAMQSIMGNSSPLLMQLISNDTNLISS